MLARHLPQLTFRKKTLEGYFTSLFPSCQRSKPSQRSNPLVHVDVCVYAYTHPYTERERKMPRADIFIKSALAYPGARVTVGTHSCRAAIGWSRTKTRQDLCFSICHNPHHPLLFILHYDFPYHTICSLITPVKPL